MNTLHLEGLGNGWSYDIIGTTYILYKNFRFHSNPDQFALSIVGYFQDSSSEIQLETNISSKIINVSLISQDSDELIEAADDLDQLYAARLNSRHE